MRHGASTHQGRVRPNNEDAYLVRGHLAAVADGMGGHRAGEVASRLALQALEAFPFAGLDPEKELRAAVAEANRAVLAAAAARPELSGMGTTLTVALVGNERIWVAHVGDSRAYRIRPAKAAGGDGDGRRPAAEVRLLTQDHSVAAEMVRNGGLTEAEAERHPQRHLLTRAIGVGADLCVDTVGEPFVPGDHLVLCTDGLTGLVQPEEIAALVLGSPGPQEAAERLVALANDRGGPDNITAVVLQLDGQ